MMLQQSRIAALLLSFLLPTQPLVLSCLNARMLYKNDLNYCSMVNWNSARVYNASTARQVYYEESTQFLHYSSSETEAGQASDDLAVGNVYFMSLSLYEVLKILSCSCAPFITHE